MLVRPGLPQPPMRSQRRLWIGGCAGVLAVVLVVAWLVLRPDGAPVAAGPAPGSVSQPQAPARGWNLHDGGNLGDQDVVAPAAAPDGTSVTGTGQQAEAAGPGDYAGFQPVSITLPSGRRSMIQPAGVRSDGTLAVPDDPAQVGWWTGGALAGERYGGVVLAGHVDSKQYGVGVMAEMLHARTGAVISVTGPASASGVRRQKYQITQVKQIEKARLAADTGAFDQSVSQRLVLITCGGPFDARKHHYRDNIVVIATPVQ